MTLIEVVIAFAILLMVLVPVALLLSNTIGQAASSRQRLTALSLAEQYIEKLNNTPVLLNTTTPTAHKAIETTTNHTVPKTDVTVKVGSAVHSTVSYTIYARFTWALHENATPDLCTAGTAPTLLDLQVTVEWGRSTQKITDTTLINFPATGILTEGFLAIDVDGDPVTGPPADANGHAWSTRVQAVPVTIKPDPTVTTGFATTTRYPNQYGCVFQEVPPGKYTVSVADPSPGTPAGTHYGTPSWASSYDELLTETAPSPASVTVGQVTTVVFQYDEGSMVKVTYPSTTVVEGAVTCPGTGSIYCLAAGQSPASTAAPGATPTADLSVLTKSGWNVYKTAAARLVASACAGSKRCISVGDTRTGSGFRGASVSTGTATVSFKSDAVPSGVTVLNSITCPTTAKCFASGSGSSGAVILSGTVNTTSVTWTNDGGMSGVTTVHSLSCLGATTCYAAVATSSGPAILSLSGTTWAHDTLPTTPAAVTGVTQLTCRTSTCFAIGSKSGGALILSQSATSATKWIEDTIPAASSLTSVKCPTVTHCYAIGSGTSAPKIESLLSVTGTTVKWTTDSLPATVTSLTILRCPGTSACFATGSTAAGPTIVSLYHSTSTWTIDSLPTGVTALTSLTCPSTAQCAASGVATVSGSQSAVVLSLSSTAAWKKDAFRTAIHPLYLAGVACTSTDAKCAAPGATATGAILTSTTLSGTLASTPWRATSPAGITGMYLGDTPISVYNSGLTPTTTVEVASPSSTDVNTIGPLFPFTSGYEVAAAGCAAEVNSTAATVTSVPGTATTAAPTAALTMGLLPIEVQSATGSPVAGATVTIKPTCTRLTPPAGQSTQTSFALGTTDGSGVTGLAVMYGTYQVTAKSGATSVTDTVTVSKTSVKVGATTTTLPTPAVIQL